jgi:type IV pilus assembly protein PilY1
MKTMNSSFRKGLLAIGLASVVVAGHAQAADLLNLSKEPLFLTAAVEPNIYFVLDDSGSMDLEILTVDDEGGSGRGLDKNGRTVGYVFDNSSNAYRNNNGSYRSFARWVPDEEQDADETYWKFKDPSYNLMYYDKDVEYEPWPGFYDYRNDASWTAVPLDPEYPARGSLNLESTSPYTVAKYYTWDDKNDNGNRDADEGVENPIADMGNFANWFAYYRKRNYSAWNAIGRVIARDRSSFRSSILRFRNLWSHGGSNNTAGRKVYNLAVAADKSALLEELFCQSRSYCSSTGGTPARTALKTLGDFFADSNGPILPETTGGKCQQNFNITVTDGYWNGNSPNVGNTDGPVPDGDADEWDGGFFADAFSNTLADVAMEYYETDLKPTYQDKVPVSDDPIYAARVQACQVNPTLASCPPYMHQHLVTYTVAFGVQGTLDLGVEPDDPAFPGWPQPSADQPETVDDLWHAAYNGRGQFLSARKPDELTERLDRALKDIEVDTSSSSSVALNTGSLTSDTLLFQARFDSGDWSGQLLARSVVSSGPNVGQVNQQPLWDAGCTITGLAAGEVCLRGDRDPSTGLPIDTVRTNYPGQTPNSRKILTFNPTTNAGVAFQIGNLDTNQVNALNTNPDTGNLDNPSRAADRVAFLRGQTEDVTGITVSDMRQRSRLLGDIINSNPVYVAAPSFGYPDSLESVAYSSFVSSKQNRTPIVYFGANDGMLHGIDARSDSNGGFERLAYIPSPVYENLSKLTSVDYGRDITHQPFVDAPPTAGDVFYSNSWKTVLVGGLGAGGKGIFALDVTDPSSFSEGSAASTVLWEFTDADDSDLGFTYPQPAIVRLQDISLGGSINSRWAAIVSNGYNSANGSASIFVIDIKDGSIIKEFNTNTGPADDPLGPSLGLSRANGMATPSPVDLDGDNKVDLIYAGDLFGNVWKIDVSDSNPNNWGFSFGTASSPTPLFVAKNDTGIAQPITSKIEVGLHPNLPGQIINFGTGKYLEVGDNLATGQPTQVFFGIWDRNETGTTPTNITRDHLLSQEIVEEKLFPNSTIEVRVTTNKTIQWHLGGGAPAASSPPSDSDPKLGWYMDLVNTEGGNTDNLGERVVSDPVLRDGKIIFVTVLPDEDPCDFGGDSWLMEIEAASGSRLDETPFDLNGDGFFNIDDYVTYDGNQVPVSGIKSGVGIMPSPGILKDNEYSEDGKGREFKYFSGTSGEIQRVSESRGTGAVGRQSWREIYAD